MASSLLQRSNTNPMFLPMQLVSHPSPALQDCGELSDCEYVDARESWDSDLADLSGILPAQSVAGAGESSGSSSHSSSGDERSSVGSSALEHCASESCRSSLGCPGTPSRDSPHAVPMQTIDSKSPAWVLRWSLCGQYLLSGGADGVVRMWERGAGQVPSLSPHPVRLWRGHTAPVTDASWTGNGLAVTSSMDHTARVWSTSNDACVMQLEHPDIVTSVSSNSQCPGQVATGCLDNHIRVWQIDCVSRTARLVSDVDLKEFVTSVCWTPLGRIIAGTDDGNLILVDPTSSRVVLCVAVRSFSGKRSSVAQRKVTGVVCFGAHAIVTCADCRIRIFEIASLRMISKFRGLCNRGSVYIRASISFGGAFVASPSDGSKLLIWNTPSAQLPCASQSFMSSILHRHSIAPGQTLPLLVSACAALFFPGSGIEGRFIVVADKSSRISIYDRLAH